MLSFNYQTWKTKKEMIFGDNKGRKNGSTCWLMRAKCQTQSKNNQAIVFKIMIQFQMNIYTEIINAVLYFIAKFENDWNISSGKLIELTENSRI